MRLVLMCLTLLLAACARQALPPQYDQATWQAQRQKLEQLTHWSLTGRLAIITADSKGSARLFWEQQGEDYRLNLSNMLGNRIMEMHKQGNRVEIIDDKGVRHDSNDPGLLIYRLTGWQLPVEQLPDWIKGLPGRGDFSLGADGRLEEVRDSDWTLHYLSFLPQQGWLLPERIQLAGPATQLKLAINQWRLNQ